MVPRNNVISPAVTPAYPVPFAVSDFSQFEYFQTLKSLASQVCVFFHSSLTVEISACAAASPRFAFTPA